MANKVSEEEMNEEEWLSWYKKQELPQYPKPAFTVDNLIFNVTSDAVYILLVKRKNHPFKEGSLCQVASLTKEKISLKPPSES